MIDSLSEWNAKHFLETLLAAVHTDYKAEATKHTHMVLNGRNFTASCWTRNVRFIWVHGSFVIIWRALRYQIAAGDGKKRVWIRGRMLIEWREWTEKISRQKCCKLFSCGKENLICPQLPVTSSLAEFEQLKRISFNNTPNRKRRWLARKKSFAFNKDLLAREATKKFLQLSSPLARKKRKRKQRHFDGREKKQKAELGERGGT